MRTPLVVIVIVVDDNNDDDNNNSAFYPIRDDSRIGGKAELA